MYVWDSTRRITEPSVHGLNLTVPEDARNVIKPWNEREDTSKYADSGVDDQVHQCFLCGFGVLTAY